MKLIYNIEVSNLKEVVLSHKVFYNVELNDKKEKTGNFILDETRTKESVIKNKSMDKIVSGKDMSDYIRDHIGRKKWKIVESLGTINLFKKKKKVNDEKKVNDATKPVEVKKEKKNKK